MQFSGIELVIVLAELKIVARMIEVRSEGKLRSGRLSRRSAKSERAVILSSRSWQTGRMIRAI